METDLSFADLQQFRDSRSDLSRIAARAASRTDLNQVCGSAAPAVSQHFSIDIPTMTACNQRSSGRCWIFAGLNLLREKVAREQKLDNLELSQNYLSFYDHLEKANTFYEHILSTADRPLDDRYVSMLFREPVGDGGWWEYFVGLCLKYGAVPQEAMPDTYQSQHTDSMNTVLNMQLRKDALVLRKALAEGRQEIRKLKTQMLSRVYSLLCVCLGEPPRKFDFEAVARDKQYRVFRDLTPREFYDRFIGVDLQNIVSILHAPLESVPFHQVCYTQGEESIYGVWQARRLNLPLEEFKEAVLRQLKAGEPVWFVCDCDYYGSKELGVWDTELYDYEAFFGLDLALSKGELLESRQCSLNHAMVLTGVNLVDGVPDKWKIQNSWGTDCGSQGYFVMSDRWFDRYVFTASIHRNYLTEAQNRQFDGEALVLPPWNVLG